MVEKWTQPGHNVRIGIRKRNPAFDWNNPTNCAEAPEGIERAYVVYYSNLAVTGGGDAITVLTKEGLREGLEKVVLKS